MLCPHTTRPIFTCVDTLKSWTLTLGSSHKRKRGCKSRLTQKGYNLNEADVGDSFNVSDFVHQTLELGWQQPAVCNTWLQGQMSEIMWGGCNISFIEPTWLIKMICGCNGCLQIIVTIDALNSCDCWDHSSALYICMGRAGWLDVSVLDDQLILQKYSTHIDKILECTSYS